MTKQKTLRVIGVVYGAVLLCSLVVHLWQFAADSIGRANGTLQTHTFTMFSQFERQDVEPVLEMSSDRVAFTTSEDPQLLLNDLETLGTVRTVSFSIEYSKNPGEVTLYYTGKDQPFDKDKKVWGKQQNDGSYQFTLPRTEIGRLRVDPTNQKGVSMTLKSFTLNEPRSFFSYFTPSYESAFQYFVYTGLFAAALCYALTEFAPMLKKRKTVK